MNLQPPNALGLASGSAVQTKRFGGAPVLVPYKPDALVWVASTIILTSIWRVHDLIPLLGKTKIALLAMILGAMMLFGNRKRSRLLELVRTPVGMLLVALFAQLSVSALFSIQAGMSRSFMARDFLQTALGFFIIAGAVRNTRDLRWLIGTFVIGAVIFGTHVALFQRELDGVGRLRSIIYYDANDLSLGIVCALPLALVFLRATIPLSTRLITACSLAPMMITFQLAGSRGGFLGLVVVVICALFGYKGIKLRSRMVVLVGGVVTLVALGGSSYGEKLKSIVNPEEDYNMTAETGRLQLWKNAVDLVSQRPLVGFGPRTFSQASGVFSALAIQVGGIKWARAHNGYAEIAAEAGVLGFLFYVGMVFSGLFVAARCRRLAFGEGPHRMELGVLAQSVAIALLGFIICSMFLSSEYLAMLYALLGFAVASEHVRRSELQPRAIPAPIHQGRGRQPAGWRMAPRATPLAPRIG